MEHSHEDLLTIVDEEGNETLYEILFTFDSDEYERSYVVLVPHVHDIDDDEELETSVYAYIEHENGEEGSLQEIHSDEEWEMIEEVISTFLDENFPE